MGTYQTKYIVFTGPYTEEMLIFGDTLKHSDVAIRMGVLNNMISAGFLHISLDEEGSPTVKAYGESTSLEVKARPEKDTYLAQRVLVLLR